MIIDSASPLTDALVHPNGCLASNLLEHARQMESKVNMYRQMCDRLRARNYRKEGIIEILTQENETLKAKLQFFENNLDKSAD
jgi:hypothetical protein